MEMMKVLQLNIYAFFILLIIYGNGKRMKHQLFAHKLFMSIVVFDMFLIMVDSLAWVFNGLPGNISYFCNWFFNTLLYLFAVVPPLLWLIYADFQVFQNQISLKRLRYFLCIIAATNTILTAVNIFTGWYFYIDSANVYHRGSLFMLHALLSYSCLLVASVIIFINRKNIEKKYFITLLLFPLPVLIGSLLQVAFYGLLLNWSTMAVSVLFIYFNIQDLNLSTDYLTGLYNRRQFDSYLNEKIKASAEHGFSAVFTDLDGFKQINDTLGHHKGDDALQEAAELFKKNIKQGDFVARIGGDEFFLILGIDNRPQLEEFIGNIRSAAQDYNAGSGKPYKLRFSMGYDVYDRSMDAESFIRHMDKLMYQHKNSSKNG